MLTYALDPDLVAGYRVLRTIARGRARVLLGFEPGDEDVGREPVVLKLISAPDAAGSRMAVLEIAAIERAQGDHVVGLRDVGGTEDEVCAVLEWLPGGTLRDRLARGDAAAALLPVLAPVGAAVERLHAAGVSHGSIAADAVGLRADGAPALIGFGRARLFPPGLPEAALEQDEGVRMDRRALRAFALDLLDRAGPAAAPARAELAAVADRDVTAWLRTRVPAASAEYGWREPAWTGRYLPIEALPPVDEDAAPAAPARGGLLGALGPILDRSPTAAARSAIRDRWNRLAPGRRRLLVGGAVIAAALGIGLGMPAGGIAPEAPPAEVAPATPTVSAPESATPEDPAPAALSPDPVEAVAQLLELRTSCLRELSLLCLEDVDQPGSVALAADRELIRAALRDGVLPPESVIGAGTATLVERLGDGAIVEVAAEDAEMPAASLLLVQGEAGWRIRDVLPGGEG